jgi:hypothetical protein
MDFKDDKKAAELDAVKYFLKQSGLFRGYSVYPAEPPYPDIVLKSGSKEIGIEVTRIFEHGEFGAKRHFGIEKTIEEGFTAVRRYAFRELDLAPANLKMIPPLNNALLSKSKKEYPVETILLIDSQYPPFEKADYLRYIDQVKVPSVHPFSEIWLICDMTRSPELLRLFPS